MSWDINQLEIKNTYCEIGRNLVRPSTAHRDQTATFDRELWKELGNTGLFGICMPKEYGGAGLGIREFAAALEGFSEGCQDMGVLVTLVAQVALVQSALVNYGTKEQCERWLPDLIQGNKLACFGITERGCGSDVRSIKTRAEHSMNGYVLTGQKWNITNAPVADICMTFAKIPENGAKSIACFVVETSDENVQQSEPFDLMGNRGTPIGSIDFNDVEVSDSNIVSDPEDGLAVLYFSFLLERVLTGYVVSGCLAPLTSECTQYSMERQAFGQPIGNNQYLQSYIVELETKHELLRSIMFRALDEIEAGQDCSKLASIIKMYSSEVFHESALAAMRVHGNYGYRKDNYYERLLRDALGLLFAGGTAEVHKRVIWEAIVNQAKHVDDRHDHLKLGWNSSPSQSFNPSHHNAQEAVL